MSKWTRPGWEQVPARGAASDDHTAAWTLGLVLALLAATDRAQADGTAPPETGAAHVTPDWAGPPASVPARLLAAVRDAPHGATRVRVPRRALQGLTGGWRIVAGAPPLYAREGTTWMTPYDVLLARQVTLGRQRVEVGAGVRGWCDRPQKRPEGWGVRVTLTFALPQ